MSSNKPVAEVRVGAGQGRHLAQPDRIRCRSPQRHLLAHLQGCRWQLEVHFQLRPRRPARRRQGRRHGAHQDFRGRQRPAGRPGQRTAVLTAAITRRGESPAFFLSLQESTHVRIRAVRTQPLRETLTPFQTYLWAFFYCKAQEQAGNRELTPVSDALTDRFCRFRLTSTVSPPDSGSPLSARKQ